MLSYPIYEFILWDNCNNKCGFCFQAKSRECFSLLQKEQSISLVEDKLKSINEKCNVLFVGGEIFDDLLVSEKLIELFQIVVQMKHSKLIDYIYINTNILYRDLKLLFQVLDLFENNAFLQYVRFTTSFDENGRFTSDAQKKLFLANLDSIRSRYPHLNVVINSILTKSLCLSMCSKESQLYSLANKCSFVNLLPYVVNNQQLMASKEQIFHALIQMNKHFPGYLSKYVKNINLLQKRFIYRNNNNQLEDVSEENSSCGHCLNFKRYSSSGSCFICDVNQVFSDFL